MRQGSSGTLPKKRVPPDQYRSLPFNVDKKRGQNPSGNFKSGTLTSTEIDIGGNKLVSNNFEEQKLHDALSGDIKITTKSAYLSELPTLSEPPLSPDENIAQGRVEILRSGVSDTEVIPNLLIDAFRDIHTPSP